MTFGGNEGSRRTSVQKDDPRMPMLGSAGYRASGLRQYTADDASSYDDGSVHNHQPRQHEDHGKF